MYVYVDYLIIIEIILVNDMHVVAFLLYPYYFKSDVEGRRELIWYYGLRVGAYLGNGAYQSVGSYSRKNGIL